MNVDYLLEIIIVILALWALYKSLPSKKEVEWERWLSCFLRSQLTENDINDLKKNIERHTKDTKWITNLVQETSSSLALKPFSVLEWNEVSAHSHTMNAFLQRKLQKMILVGQCDFAINFAELTKRERLYSFDIEKLSSQITQKSQRFCFIVEKEEVQQFLEFFHQYPAVRDYTMAIMMIDPIFDPEWAAEHFTQTGMDVELNQPIPYFIWGRDSRPVLFEPASDPNGFQSIEMVNFGQFPAEIQEKWLITAMALVLLKALE